MPYLLKVALPISLNRWVSLGRLKGEVSRALVVLKCSSDEETYY